MAAENAESNNSLPLGEGGGGASTEYDASSIRHLSDIEHIRTRPGMYIGRLGDGSQTEDGIYVLLKEAIDNSIDEFRMNEGKRIEIDIEDNLRVTLRDYGRGIPQEKMIEAVSQLNTGGKYDSKAFKKSVGMNGVGIKAVNFLYTLRGAFLSRRQGAYGRLRARRTGERHHRSDSGRARHFYLL